MWSACREFPDTWVAVVVSSEANDRRSILARCVVRCRGLGSNHTSRDASFGNSARSFRRVGRLLTSGVSPNVVDADGTPALMAATLFANAETVELVLKRGADPNKADASGSTALMWAVSDEDKVRLLVARGANVNAKSTTERTPLLVAASLPRTAAVLRILLDRGADLRAQDRAGATALALAVRSADVDVVRFLVERGLDPNALSVVARRPGLPATIADLRLLDGED